MKYKDQLHLLVIYAREAHPYDGNPMGYSSDSAGNPISQPATYAERVANARKTIEEAELIMPVLIDEIENPLWCSYGRLPNNAYLISSTGEVLVYQKWNDPGEMEQAINDYFLVGE